MYGILALMVGSVCLIHSLIQAHLVKEQYRQSEERERGREGERERGREGEREGGRERERGREGGIEINDFFIIFLFFSFAVFIRIFITGAWRFAVLLVSLQQWLVYM